MILNRGGASNDGLDATRASILSAYYALRVEHDAEQIGTREIAKYLKRRWPTREVPSDSVIQRALAAAGLPHRGRGKPSLVSRATPSPEPDVTAQASPLLPIRRESPRLRGPK